jgi:hypothetical protein
MHPDDGQIRAYIDGELAEGPNRAADAQHIAGCPTCQARLAELKAQASLVSQNLAFLTPPAEGAPSASDRAAQRALAQFHNRLHLQKENPMKNSFFRRRTLWVGLTVFIVLVIGLSIPSGFAWAGQFLSLFRVQQVTVLPIDPTGLAQLKNSSTLAQQMGELLAKSITFEKKPGEPIPAASADEASKLAGFTVRLPASPTSQPSLTVQPGAAFEFTVDRNHAQALLDESGHTDLILPQSLDNANISVNIPDAVSAAYGNCPTLQNTASDPDIQGTAGRLTTSCVILAEMPSPTVDAPPDINFQQLAQIGLEFTGMSPEQAQEVSKNIDWTSSLVIPLPKNAASYQNVTVDGVSGVLIQRAPDDAPEFALIWVKDGIIYTIGGLGNNSAQAIEMANSMP